MEIALTKMSKNGQVVIPAEIRKDAKISPFSKFIIFNNKGNIMLKLIKKEELEEEMRLIQTIKSSEEEIKKGNIIKADSSMTAEEIDRVLNN